MSKAPAFQFYASDFVGSATVGTSTAEEVGIYVLLLSKDWMETGFVFDEARLALWCKVSVRVFRKAWAHLAEKFPAREVDGVLRHFNPRLEAERVKQAAYRAVQSAKGVASGQSRRNRGSTPAEPRLNPCLTGGGTGDEPGGNSPFPSSALATAVALARGNGHRGSPSRSGAGDLVPIRPHLPAVAIAPPWCAECGPGELVTREGQRRPVRVHATSCSQWVAPAAVAPRVEVLA